MREARTRGRDPAFSDLGSSDVDDAGAVGSQQERQGGAIWRSIMATDRRARVAAATWDRAPRQPVTPLHTEGASWSQEWYGAGGC
jgi:hypothetical protein